MIEKPPNVNVNSHVISLLTDSSCKKYLKKAEKEYYYWDKAKYNVPKGVKADDFWSALKIIRTSNSISFGKYNFNYKINDYMQEYLYKFDMDLINTSSLEFASMKGVQEYYLLSSTMEEAIASSQMEGASTTRIVAKEMLKKKKKPKDISQQMILNNYNTIRFLSENKNLPLSKDFLLEIHKKITEKTLEKHELEGHFRLSDDIVVQNVIDGEVAHYPPKAIEIDSVINDLCDFANNDNNFIHPVIKAIIIHFVISFLHPFVDGNGRTARSLFYWYMLKKGYALTEFLSISRIIYANKVKYEKAFLYTEYDDYDLGYFIKYNLVVISKAYDELKAYLDRKNDKELILKKYANITDLNERQIYILKKAVKKPDMIFTSRDLVIELGVSIKTIRLDLENLVSKKIFQYKPLNKRLMGYILASDFSYN